MDRLHFDVHDGDGPPMLLVHGFLSSRAQWLANLEALRTVCRPITVELWGHGRSPTPENSAAYAVCAYVAEFERIRRELGIERWFICGQSFGAGLTLRYALDAPQVVRAQVITNSVSALTAPTNAAQEREISARAILNGGAEGLRAMPIHPRFSRRLPSDVAAALNADAELLSVRGVANAIRFSAKDLAIGEALSSVQAPLLLVNGLWEKAFQPLRLDLPNRVPGVQIEDVAAGHAVNAEAPVAFNDRVVRFLSTEV